MCWIDGTHWPTHTHKALTFLGDLLGNLFSGSFSPHKGLQSLPISRLLKARTVKLPRLVLQAGSDPLAGLM